MTGEIKEILEDIKNTEECSLSGKNALFLLDYITNLQQDIANYVKITLHDRKEIERLNNIINKIEYYIKTEIPEEEFVNTEWYVNILDKLKELKESEK